MIFLHIHLKYFSKILHTYFSKKYYAALYILDSFMFGSHSMQSSSTVSARHARPVCKKEKRKNNNNSDPELDQVC